MDLRSVAIVVGGLYLGRIAIVSLVAISLILVSFLFLYLVSTYLLIYFSEIIRETAFVNKKIIKAEKLEIVSHLAASISHEVRNP